MDENNDDLGLDLGLALNDYTTNNNKPKKIKDYYNSSLSINKRKSFLDLSIPLHTSDPRSHGLVKNSSSSLKILGKDVMKQGVCEIGFSVSGSKEDDDGDESNYSRDFSCRKKLRLTSDQTTLLEDSFKHQTTLNTAQKHALAEKLKLKPRQVEVWFQNRRARTKLKQTEVDCEFLKRNCERLSEENWRLKKEVLELRSAMKMEKGQPQYFHDHNNKHAAAAGANRGGGEKKEAAAKEVVHVSPNK